MENKLLALIIMAVALLVVLPNMSNATAQAQTSTTIYGSGNESLTFSGNSVHIRFHNSSGMFSWKIYEISNGKLKLEKLRDASIHRILSSDQNSVVKVMNNSNIQVAQIFSFYNNAIDASVAIHNLQDTNSTFLVLFNVITNNNGNLMLYGPRSGKITLNNQNVGTIPSIDTAASTENLAISWSAETSLLHLNGTVSTNMFSNKITVPFGPVKISSNETYSIDPVITPVMFNSDSGISPMKTAPCTNCGGGGGSGGGVTYSSPSVSASIGNGNMTASNNDGETVYYYLTGVPINLEGDVTSLGGASSGTVQFDVNYGGYYYDVHSETVYGTGTYSYTWMPPWYATGYYAYKAYVSNPSYASFSKSYNLGVFPPAPSSTSQLIYTASGGVRIASMTLSTDFGRTTGGDLYYWNGGVNTYARFATAVEWSNTSSNISGVWSVDQTISNYKAIGSYSGGKALVFSDAYVATQSVSNNALMEYLAEYLVGIANSFAFGVIPNPSYFYAATGDVSASSTSAFSYNYTALSIDDPSPILGGQGTIWTPLLGSNGNASHLFGLVVPSSTFVNDVSGQYLSLIEYSVTLTFTTPITSVYGNIGDVHYYGASDTLITGIYIHPSG